VPEDHKPGQFEDGSVLPEKEFQESMRGARLKEAIHTTTTASRDTMIAMDGDWHCVPTRRPLLS
jgi:hypothetical protein